MLYTAGAPLPKTTLVKFAFLLGNETPINKTNTFYSFVPYKFGPFSFELYRDLSIMEEKGLVIYDEVSKRYSYNNNFSIKNIGNDLGYIENDAICNIINRYGKIKIKDLISDVYRRYPWYASKSELKSESSDNIPESRQELPLLINTIGYEGRSVDGFFNALLEKGMKTIIDVRANPVSRKYGFAKKSMSDIAQKLGIEYKHFPELGIPSDKRENLSDYNSYCALLDNYEKDILPSKKDFISLVASVQKEKPSVLLCMEREPGYCHRSRLANAVSEISGLPVNHL